MRSLSLVVIKRCTYLITGDFTGKSLVRTAPRGVSRHQRKASSLGREQKPAAFVNFCFSEREAPVYLTDILACRTNENFRGSQLPHVFNYSQTFGANGLHFPGYDYDQGGSRAEYLWVAVARQEAECMESAF